jgi:hypothetical protein
MIGQRFLRALPMLALAAAFAACTAEVEEEGDLPNVEVTDEGNLPEVDIDPAQVDVTTDTQQVVTPDIDVTPTEGDDP